MQEVKALPDADFQAFVDSLPLRTRELVVTGVVDPYTVLGKWWALRAARLDAGLAVDRLGGAA